MTTSATCVLKTSKQRLEFPFPQEAKFRARVQILPLPFTGFWALGNFFTSLSQNFIIWQYRSYIHNSELSQGFVIIHKIDFHVVDNTGVLSTKFSSIITILVIIWLFVSLFFYCLPH